MNIEKFKAVNNFKYVLSNFVEVFRFHFEVVLQ